MTTKTRAEGSADMLVGVVKQKTGATRREVEQFLTSVLDSGNPWATQIAESAQRYADEAKTYLQQNARRVASQASDYSAQLAHTVRSKPTESLAIVFGIGLAAGALFFMGRKR